MKVTLCGNTKALVLCRVALCKWMHGKVWLWLGNSLSSVRNSFWYAD